MEEGRNRDVIAAVLFAMGGAVDTEALARACGCDKRTAAEAARSCSCSIRMQTVHC